MIVLLSDDIWRSFDRGMNMAMFFRRIVSLVFAMSISLAFQRTAECDNHSDAQECEERDKYYSLHHVCRPACLTTGDCLGAEQCLCDGRCGLSCVDVTEGTSCPLPVMSHSNVLLWMTPPQGASVPEGFGTTVHFSCDPGYELVGHNESTCMSNGRWAEDSPYCVSSGAQTDCAEPDGLENGRVVVEGEMFEARYECLEGFHMMGRRHSIRCIPGVGWEPLEVECVKLKCDSPGAPDNGFITSLDFQYGSIVTHRCLPSHVLNGSASLTCLSNGTWNNDVPTCEPQSCPVPDFSSGAVRLSDEKRLIGSWAMFECPEGYDLRGSGSTECMDDLTWSHPPPICEVATCTRPTLLTSGLSITVPGLVFNYNESITYRCLKWRERLHGGQTRRCGMGGQWTGEEPSCHEICSSLPDRIPRGYSINVPSDALYNWNGGQKIYFCNEHFRMIGTSNFLCRSGGWSSGDFPRCEDDQSSAYPIRSLTHAIVDGVLTVKQREVVKLECRLPAASSGIWERDGQSPSDRSLTFRRNDTRWYSLHLFEVAQSDAGLYRCTTSERLNSNIVQIEVIPTCPDPGYQEGRQTNRDTTGGVTAGRRGFVRFTCDPGYTMVGDYDQIGCGIDGNWNYDPPDCVKPSCLDAYLPQPVDGRSERTVLADGLATQTFYCPIGYRMLQDGVTVPAPQLVVGCRDGVWNGTAPSCVQRNDMMTITTTGLMDHRNITTYDGYELEINCTQIGAQSQPRWFKLEDPILELAVGDGGGVAVLRFPVVSVSDAGEYTCSNFDMSYDEVINLNVIVRCDTPLPISNGSVALSTGRSEYYEGDEVAFECDEGFLLNGDSHVQCTDHGWNAVFPTCAIDVVLEVYKDGRNLQSGSNVLSTTGASVFLDCLCNPSSHDAPEVSTDDLVSWWRIAPNGERLSMATHQRRVSDGDWRLLRLVLMDLTTDHTSQYVCGTVAQAMSVTLTVTVPCETPAPLANGNIVLSNGTRYLSVAAYECSELYELHGAQRRSCQAHGDWSGEAPTCIKAYCPSLNLLPGVVTDPDLNGGLVPTGTAVTVGCTEGMLLSGSREIVCMDNGTLHQEQETPSCTDPCLGYECPLGWKCELVGDGPSCSGCLNITDCPEPGDDGGPVCGTDARDYQSACVLAVRACQTGDSSLEKAFDGACIQGSLCFARPTAMGRRSSVCPNPEKQFYYNPDPSVLSCSVVASDECMLEGGFESLAYCEGNCSRNYCYDPPGVAGPCNQNQVYWTYDSNSEQCQTFTYGGCSGTRANQNRFETLNDCIRSCSLGEVCQPCPLTMTVSNACFYGQHAMIITVSRAERFVRNNYIRLTVDVEAVLTPPRPGHVSFERGPNQHIFCEGIDLHLRSPCDLCPRIRPLVGQPYLFMSSTYRGDSLKLDEHSFVAEWSPELEAEMQAAEACAEWVENLNVIQN
ncbi:sushi, von Willebrand factor type A, EGF and pentraxin domain-containing protein 1-like [Acanthaster planci]|uniref:Sushi, von Willebrand factor type A, EGF and pentraxin domain-containing protein 1-like n=1 Tax=Acanthaster planci TaxID=133434 RepID=A0A8B7ZU51_ACAPL|nr:sushi, von Willebrand factor type A, EGF and pentraxin domain-containing protein 1-like [Acanthaster planci]